MRPATSPVAILFLLTGGALAENWPQWRGPGGDGSSPEKNLPIEWSPTENITWKAPMSAWSGSTPIIWGDYIFLNSAGGGKRRAGGYRPDPSQKRKRDPKTKELSLWCLDRRTGEIRWKRSLGGGNRQRQKQNMSSPSPVTDGQRVWTMTGTGMIKSFDFQGNEKWSRDIQADYGEFGLGWGYASSPLLYAGTLYVQVLHGQNTDDPSYVLGIDPATGATRWRVERPTDAVAESPDSYTTPAVLRYRGKTEVVVTGGDYVSGHDPASGLELWRAGGLNPTKAGNYRIVASPLVSGDMVYVPTRKDPFQAFQFGSGTPKVLWQDCARARCADTGDGRTLPVPASRQWSPVLFQGPQWRRGLGSGESSPRNLQRFTGPGRREDLCHQRGCRDQHSRGRTRVQSCGGKPVGRVYAFLAGDLRRSDLCTNGAIPLLHRQAAIGVLIGSALRCTPFSVCLTRSTGGP